MKNLIRTTLIIFNLLYFNNISEGSPGLNIDDKPGIITPDGQSRTWNFGLVWEPDTHWRYVAELMLKDGLNETLVRNQAQNDFDGSLFRVQAQWFFN